MTDPTPVEALRDAITDAINRAGEEGLRTNEALAVLGMIAGTMIGNSSDDEATLAQACAGMANGIEARARVQRMERGANVRGSGEA